MKLINFIIVAISFIALIVCFDGLRCDLSLSDALSRKGGTLQDYEYRFNKLLGRSNLECKYHIEISRFYIALMNYKIPLQDRAQMVHIALTASNKIIDVAPGYLDVAKFRDYILTFKEE